MFPAPRFTDSYIGVHAAERIATGLMCDGELQHADYLVDSLNSIISDVPAEEIVQILARRIDEVVAATPVLAIGVGVPGFVRHGIVEESSNLPQLKGLALSTHLSRALRGTRWGEIPVFAFNDADAVAAGIAAQRAELSRVIRVWTLGTGVGFGRYPSGAGIWEGGHMVVTLDPQENRCACGGAGHLEGIMGARSMRLRFLDKEPEEVFEAANNGDPECHAFLMRWHRALAAATASCIHLDGPGEFFILGSSSRFVNIRLLTEHVDSMVAMSALQGSTFSVIPEAVETGVLGAAINAERALMESRRMQLV